MTIMSGVMNPFDTLLGVVIRRVSSSRALMLPSLLATNPRAYRRRPASTMSARICSSARVLIATFFRTEIVLTVLDRGVRRYVRPAYRIAYQLDGRRLARRGAPPHAGGDGHQAADHTPCGANDQQENNQLEKCAKHLDTPASILLHLLPITRNGHPENKVRRVPFLHDSARGDARFGSVAAR